jgi:GH25 family lysozyme M1 (1,4-beta-N-acetylmuramidase)
MATPAATATTLSGFDVSHDQGSISWATAYNAGNTFAFAKATQGLTYIDPDFTTNMVNGKAAGFYMGAYDFACPVTDSSEYCTADSAVSEANYFDNEAGPYFKAGYMYPALDLEIGCGTISTTALSNWVVSWMSTVESYISSNDGYTIVPILYVDSSYASSSCTTSVITAYHLWVADWGVSSPSIGQFSTWNYWQYSDAGTVPGISGGVDLDYFNGGLSQIQSEDVFAGVGPVSLSASYSMSDQTSGSTLACGGTATLGDKIQFTASATGGTPPYTYAWNFGDGSTGTGSPVTHAYSSAGSVTPMLTVTDSAGNTATAGTGCTLAVSTDAFGIAVGDEVEVVATSLHCRATPSNSGTVVSTESKGEYGQVENGSVSSGGYVWWYIAYADGHTGWSAEGTGSTAWLQVVTVTLTSVAVSPASASVSEGGTGKFTATPTCTPTCPSGTTYSWALTRTTLGTLSAKTGSSVTFTAVKSTTGRIGLFVNATLNGVTVQSSATVITVTNPDKFGIAIGDEVEVVATSLHCRATPSSTGKVISIESKGELGEVENGSVSSGGYVWWYIAYADGHTGWSAEGTGSTAWLQVVTTGSVVHGPSDIMYNSGPDMNKVSSDSFSSGVVLLATDNLAKD